ncbi:MAG: hypothetical protein HY966_06085 [Ignavibacteriales bacterium]|nr:hypothetical protein [Ignavibacteriales bacterium]
MKALIADAFPARYIDELHKIGIDCEYKPKLKAEELADAIGESNVLVVRSTEVHADCIEHGKQLSLIVRAGAGVNNIDMKAANAHGIYVSNCPGKNAIAVAELTMGLLCALDRRIPDNVIDLRNGQWNKGEYSNADGLFGKTIGIVGTGQIGKEVVLRAKAFGLNVIAFSRTLNAHKAQQIGARFAATIEELISQSDIVSLHVALKPETRGLFSKDRVALLKQGAILLNTSRAEVVDEKAVFEAVKAGKIRYGADVLADEPEDKSAAFDSALGKLSGAYITHHIGASTEQAQNAVAEETVAIIREFKELGSIRIWVNRAKKTQAEWQLVVRHFDKAGVLANVLDDLRSANLNVQEVENVVFEGAQTACCTLKLDARPSDATIQSIQSRANEVIQVSLIAL